LGPSAAMYGDHVKSFWSERGDHKGAPPAPVREEARDGRPSGPVRELKDFEGRFLKAEPPWKIEGRKEEGMKPGRSAIWPPGGV